MMNMRITRRKSSSSDDKFSAKEFVDCLLGEGSTILCDDSVESFSRTDVPPFYDDELYERGRKFYHNNIFALFYSKMLGLVTVLSVPTILKILMHTRMSSTPQTAYKRYLATIFHMCVWYDSNFTPGSKLWQSLSVVRNLHNSASKKGCMAGLNGISQMDMALTQFGFMGFALSRSRKMGIYENDDEEFLAYTHIWRVVGYLMGIEDRFNICRESVQETREICKVLISTVFRPFVARKDKDFMEMAAHLIEGMWVMNPLLRTNTFLVLVFSLLQEPSENTYQNNNNNKKNDNDKNEDPYVTLDRTDRVMLNWVEGFTYYIQFNCVRIVLNLLQYLTLWLMNVCPFLAYYMYGYRNSHVKV